MLFPPWDANNGDKKQQAKSDVCQHNPKATDKKPDDIHYCGKTALGLFSLHNITTKRPKCKNAQFNGLQAKRYSDNGNHQCNTGCKIFKGDGKATKYQPDNVSEEFHRNFYLIKINSKHKTQKTILKVQFVISSLSGLGLIPNSHQDAPFQSKYFIAKRFAKNLASPIAIGVVTEEFFKEAEREKIKIEWRILVINWYKNRFCKCRSELLLMC